MIRKLILGLVPLALILAGCGNGGPEPVGSAIEAPGAAKMPDPPKRTRPEPPGNGRGSGKLSGN